MQDYWQTEAESGDNPAACCKLGLMYTNGLEVPQDDNLAAWWLRLGSRQGHARSQYHFALFLRDGKGGEDNAADGAPVDEQVVDWLEKSAAQGDNEARNVLGCAFSSGEMVPKQDFDRAFELFKAAADDGHRPACANVGTKKTIEKQHTHATVLPACAPTLCSDPVGWRAACSGNCYSGGVGVARDVETAEEYRAKAEC